MQGRKGWSILEGNEKEKITENHNNERTRVHNVFIKKRTNVSRIALSTISFNHFICVHPPPNCLHQTEAVWGVFCLLSLCRTPTLWNACASWVFNKNQLIKRQKLQTWCCKYAPDDVFFIYLEARFLVRCHRNQKQWNRDSLEIQHALQ